jgi:proline iminopeptidase
MTETEGYLEVDGGRIWYRSVGEGGIPLLCLHGGPGFTHYYLEPLEALADRRQVIFYDQLGCGRSDRPADQALWTVGRFVQELAQVRSALGLTRLHLFGSSWGGMLAMQYVLDRRPELDSLILCGSPASMTRWVSDCTELLSAQPAEVRQVIREHEAAGFTACPEYQAAILGFYREHVCRVSPRPASLERSFAEAGYEVYPTMKGPSEFTVTGTLKTWDVMDRLGEIGATAGPGRMRRGVSTRHHDQLVPDPGGGQRPVPGLPLRGERAATRKRWSQATMRPARYPP